jgi:hypothetical protein
MPEEVYTEEAKILILKNDKIGSGGHVAWTMNPLAIEALKSLPRLHHNLCVGYHPWVAEPMER